MSNAITQSQKMLYAKSKLLYTIFNKLERGSQQSMKSFTAGKNEEGVRLSRFVQNVTKDLPTSLLYKSFRNKRIKVNGKKAAPETRLQTGDLIELYINDEFFPANAGVKRSTAPKKTPLPEIIEEDCNLVFLYKPAHRLCHSDRTGDLSLIEQLHYYLYQKQEYLPEDETTFSPAICNRLDRGTEGLVIAAKNYASLRDMNSIIRDDFIRKEYFAITCGVPPQGRHTAWLKHHEKNNKVEIRSTFAEGFKEIITDISVERVQAPFALCRIGLVTGRTHQIRAHLAFLNAPVLGDVKYGSKKMNEKTQKRTQELCAVHLSFKDIPQENSLHYLSGKKIELQSPAILQRFTELSDKYSCV